EQYRQVTGVSRQGPLDYYCNNTVEYTLRGVPVSLEIAWEWEAPGSGDVYEAAFTGTRARVEIRQGAAQNYVPELYIVPADADSAAAAGRRVAALQSRWPGVAAAPSGADLHITVPPKYRVGHEAHFAQVTNRFAGFVHAPDSMPAWENAFMLAKYYVSTKGTEVGQ
ncbi:MAG: oxidoreductase, partial [Acidobacteriota bacterium]|nr:oxidoreductase [Acidobacteriota bacterium]